VAKDGYDQVTLELTPDQAAAVAAAQAPRLVAHALADRQATDALEGR
jgi:Flp pilus assembly protein CpaB